MCEYNVCNMQSAYGYIPVVICYKSSLAPISSSWMCDRGCTICYCNVLIYTSCRQKNNFQVSPMNKYWEENIMPLITPTQLFKSTLHFLTTSTSVMISLIFSLFEFYFSEKFNWWLLWNLFLPSRYMNQ